MSLRGKRHRAKRDCRSRPFGARLRRGILLVVVLVVISLLTLSGMTFARLMVTHRQAVSLSGRRVQARMFAESGVEAVRWFLMQPRDTREELGGHYNNVEFFQAQIVAAGATASAQGNFTLLAPELDQSGAASGIRYGLQDESTRLNLNTVLLADKITENGGRDLLMGLPGMTEEIADAILDWIDTDDDEREFGAEADYYQQLTPPYTAKNGPLDTIEELLLVRGVTPQLLYGLDINRNGLIDVHEQGTSSLMTSTTSSDSSLQTDPAAQIGWAAYITLYSQERNVNQEGLPRVNLNQEDMKQLHQELSEIFPADWVTFIVAYRQSGPYDGSEEGEVGTSGELDLDQPGQTVLSQVLDLIGKKVRVQFQGEDEDRILASPFVDDPAAMLLYLPRLMDNVTISPTPTLPGRININQAPRVVLLGIPGMSEEIVDKIIAERSADVEDETQDENRRFETWIMAEGIVTVDEMRMLEPLITGGGDVYRAQIVGYFEDGSAAARLEVVFDATSDVPRLLNWRDMTHLGRGFPLDVLGVRLLQVR